MTLIEKILNDSKKTNATGVLVICTSTKRALINKRSNLVPTPNTWAIFGGMVDDTDASNEDACKRELSEEAGYSGNMKLISAYLYKKDGFEYQNYIGLVEKEFTPKLNDESSDYAWASWQTLWEIEPKHYGLDALLKNSSEIIEKYLTPTLTEKILKEVVELDLNQFVSNINSIKSKYIAMGCKLDIGFKIPQALSIDMIRVPNIKQGVGTEIMTTITNLCDKYNVICVLSPVQDYGSSKERLIKFYKRFGFEFNQGKNKDFRFMYKMIRQPK